MSLLYQQTRSTYNQRVSRRHLVLDSEYTNITNNASRRARHSLEPKAAATKSLRGNIPNAPHNEVNTPQESGSSQGLESWEGVSPATSALLPLLPGCGAPVVVSTTQHTGRRYEARKPLQILKHKPHSPLPPSSPPEPSSQVKNSVEQLEDNWGAKDIDPFGFFAAEKRLKARKPFVSPRFIPKGLVEMSNFSEGDSIVGEAFAVQAGQVLRRDKAEPSCQARRKRPASDISSLYSIFTKSSSEPSSPCQLVARRKSGAYKDNQEKKGKSRAEKAKKAKKDPKLLTIELEDLLPKRPKRRVRLQVRANGKEVRTSDGEIRTRKVTNKTTSARATMLSHLDDEGRKKFERERQDRLKYYKELDTYCIAKENVWIV